MRIESNWTISIHASTKLLQSSMNMTLPQAFFKACNNPFRPDEQARALSIGSGVTLHYEHENETEGTALVDLGSGVYGEKPWSEAHAMTIERKEGITHLHKDLSEQATKLEVKITELAQEFNDAAATLQPTQPTPSPQPAPTDSPQPPAEDKPRRSSRRGGRFGNELTLDD
jgi:hypothetical protein